MILVTGGTGLLGSHLLYRLVQDHERIRAIRRSGSNLSQVKYIFSLYSKDAGRLFDRIEWVEAEIGDKEALERAFRGIEHVFHCAASVSFDPRERKKMIRNNIQGTANLVNACLKHKVKKLCYVSSTATLGSAGENDFITEDMNWNISRHRSSYSITKFKSEMEVWRGIAEGLNAVIVNPSIIIGPGDWNRSSSRLFSAVWKGIKYYTEGVTGYVDVRDVVTCMVYLLRSDVSGERFIISSENLTYRRLFEMIAKQLDKKPPRYRAGTLLIAIAWRLDWLNHFLTGKPRNITRETVLSSRQKSFFSNEKIRRLTNLEFIPVADSIKDTAHFFLNRS